MYPLYVGYMANLYPQPNFKTTGGRFIKDEHPQPLSKHFLRWSTSTIAMDCYKLHLSTPNAKGGTGKMIHAQTSSGEISRHDELILTPHNSRNGSFLSYRAVQHSTHYLLCLADIWARRLDIADFNLPGLI